MEPIEVESLSGAPLKDMLLSLPVNIRMCWKSLSGTNAIGDFAFPSVTKKKILTPVANVI